MTNISTGLHLVRKRLKTGDRWYVYAKRGGALIHKQDGPKPAITRELLTKAFEANQPRRKASNTVDKLIDAYRLSPAFTSKRAATQREYRHRLDQVSQRFGGLDLGQVPALKPAIVRWQDELADTPRSADRVVGMMHTLFRWAENRGFVERNPAEGIAKLHKVNRADLIWEDRHWQAIEALDNEGKPKVPLHIQRVFRLGALTGLRISDLLALRWEDVGRDYIAVSTKKTGGVATIPMHPELKSFLVGPGAGHILRNSRLELWTPDGFSTSWGRVKPEGFDRKMHDLRGTFATRLMIAGFSDPEVAAMMGWQAERSAAIRMRYVDRDRVAREMAARFSA